MIKPKDIKLLPKKHLCNWLAELDHYRLFGPVQRDKYTEFTRIEDPSQFNIGIRNTIISPKGFLLDQSKRMMNFNLNENPPGVIETITDDEANVKQVILGIRSCDTFGFKAVDLTFDSEFKDPYYISVRDRTILVGLACNEIDKNCFCTSVGGGPFDGSGMDIMMVDLGQAIIFNIYSDNGLKLVSENSELFEEPSGDQLKEQETRRLESMEVTKTTRRIETDGIPTKLGESFESNYWQTVSQKCLGCGICTYLCPTCYCFDITDEKRGLKGERVRTWDSCMYPEYTVHASGYNPRPARMNRLRNRFYHKFKYYPDLYNVIGCTGCGRCIRHCPVNIDIIDIINGVHEIEIEGEK
jgi:ferredoxin